MYHYTSYKILIYQAHPKVAKVLKDLIEKWAMNEFKNDSTLSFVHLHN